MVKLKLSISREYKLVGVHSQRAENRVLYKARLVIKKYGNYLYNAMNT